MTGNLLIVIYNFFTMGKDNKLHIILLGRRNSGKSSLINALTGQNIAIVSDVAGTTTDLVKGVMKFRILLPLSSLTRQVSMTQALWGKCEWKKPEMPYPKQIWPCF